MTDQPTDSRWRRYGPHSTPVSRFLRAHVRQFVGGRTWSLCLITKMERTDTTVIHNDDGPLSTWRQPDGFDYATPS